MIQWFLKKKKKRDKKTRIKETLAHGKSCKTRKLKELESSQVFFFLQDVIQTLSPSPLPTHPPGTNPTPKTPSEARKHFENHLLAVG